MDNCLIWPAKENGSKGERCKKDLCLCPKPKRIQTGPQLNLLIHTLYRGVLWLTCVHCEAPGKELRRRRNEDKQGDKSFLEEKEEQSGKCGRKRAIGRSKLASQSYST